MPALVIGIGDAGQWILTYLKKDLLEAHNGNLPNSVRLLCFNTVPQAGTKVSSAYPERQREQEIKVNSSQLERDVELIPLGQDAFGLSDSVRADSEKTVGEQPLPHISSWSRAEDWLGLAQTSSVLSRGAGALRQFGRLALFMDRHSVGSKVLSSLDTVIGYLAAQGQGLEIIIVGSISGGTGAGMLVDIAHLARQRARDIPVSIRGYLILPQAFAQDAGEDVLTRSFVACRELKRFMMADQA